MRRSIPGVIVPAGLLLAAAASVPVVAGDRQLLSGTYTLEVVPAVVAALGLPEGQLGPGETCTVRGTPGDDTWTVRRAPQAPREIAPHAVVCGGDGDDTILTPGPRFKGTFVGGRGSDSIGDMMGATFLGGPGPDRVRTLRRGTFRGGPGADRVRRMPGGRFRGGSGWNRSSIEAVALVERDVTQRANDIDGRVRLVAVRVRLVAIRYVLWSDASLGCAQPGHVSAQVQTPGYRIVVAVGKRTLVYHTDMGTRAVPASDGTCDGAPGP